VKQYGPPRRDAQFLQLPAIVSCLQPAFSKLCATEILIEKAANKQAVRHSRHSQSEQSEASAADGTYLWPPTGFSGMNKSPPHRQNLEAF
jgi:hypothetical protein